MDNRREAFFERGWGQKVKYKTKINGLGRKVTMHTVLISLRFLFGYNTCYEKRVEAYYGGLIAKRGRGEA